ncbi:MAG: reverse transcriptase family protein, partial [Mesoflavibacter sp.]|nr:reverse transcriptase family protein [Mesoflavibacter sp.]
FSKNKTEENNIAYTTYRDIYNKAIKDAKKIFYREQLDQNKDDLRKTWQTLRKVISKSNDKTSCIDEIRVNDTSYTNNNDISNKFNDYFTSIASEIASEINPSPLNPCDFIPEIDSIFRLREINTHVLVKLVKKMENKKSSDMFGLSNCLLKQIINSIAVPLVHIINQSIKTGQIPSQLKIAKVLPIFKYSNSSKMDKCNPGNYRPISLLPIFSKLLEKIVSEQLTRYLEFNQIIYEHQYGFQAKKSTLHPMIHLLNYLGQAKNEKLITVGVFCDLAKCFDTISHSILLKKLEKIGIHGLELEWFKNYLNNRNQFVYTNGEKSNLLGINKGVPQGSILGPILFLIYINDIKNCTSLMTLLFADDSNFLISGKDLNEIVEILNIELKNICDWFRCNEMSLNPTKTKFMIFNKREDTINWEEIEIKLDFNNENENDINKIRKLGYINQNSDIPAVKFLGVYIDSQLNFKYHIEYLRKKISRSMYLINRVKHLLCKKSLETLFHSFINSHLMFCLPAWSCGLESSINPLAVLQKKAIRIINRSAYNDHTPPLFKEINVLPLKELAIYTKLLFFYDFIRWKLPNSFDGVWIRNNLRNQRQLRNSNEFYIPIAKFKSIERFPLFSFQRLWNNICHEKEFLNENIPRKTFALNLKKELLKTICQNRNCTECT